MGIEKAEFYKLTAKESLLSLNSDENGLTDKEAKKRLLEFGENRILEKKRKTALQIFLDQFKSVLILILIVATIVSVILGEILDAAVIFAIVILNALLGFYQERKAEKILEALKKLASLNAKVLRNSEAKIIKSEEIVPGDILILAAGDKIQADCRLLESINLKIDESSLTGESVPVEKNIEQITNTAIISERHCMLYAATTVVYGHCKALVTATGMNTEFGHIAASIQCDEEKTPLQKKMDKLGAQLGALFLCLCTIIFIVGLSIGMKPIEIFLISIALAVAAVPEGLLASITTALSLGVYRMAQKKAVIRKLTAVETLGSTTVICTDKTGTLTVNAMTVRKIYVNNKMIDVSGEGYSTEGKFSIEGKEIAVDESLKLLLRIGKECNDASLHIGDPTEIALLVSAKKSGLDIFEKQKRIDEIEFTSERKMMSILSDRVYAKGAVEELLKKCTQIYENGKTRKLVQKDIDEINKITAGFASQGLRVLGFAYKDANKLEESDLIFAGLQAMIDPPRKEAKDAISKCHTAGIKVIMITGDHKETALAIARELGLTDHKNDGLALTGLELDEMDDSQLENIVENVSVYARVSPLHKVRITEALKKKGHVVAMTGDGINDAIALKKADIGIAMGITGTDVAKEASDIVLTDDNFATIVNAVEEGRGIYDNIKKVIAFLLSGNIAEVFIIFIAILLGMPMPLAAIQILWINLVTDGLPALALSVDPVDKKIMSRKPRPRDESIWQGIWKWIVGYGFTATACVLVLFSFGLNESIIKAQTMAFTSLIVFEKFQSFSWRSLDRPILKEIFRNKWLVYATLLTLSLQMVILYTPLNQIFKVMPLNAFEWAIIIGLGLIVFLAREALRWKKN